ncbi:probable G-protein coupled receptor 141 [Conger conger]|uniref:probable G-protein coupled receptor 141 n=1 Tax=Conger conger TaxID=82655 RepID=UPI002A59C4B7|nr:probable G-protein coupled receptor 141 [Conger conger]
MERLNNSNVSNSTVPPEYQIALVTMYSIVFVGGIVSIALMINILKSNIRSVTTMAVLNLIAVHLLFLLTVPFRIYFYATNKWHLTKEFCKVVSGMIHAHMYIAFVFYAIILVIRYHSFFRGKDPVAFHRKLHALWASLAVWAVVLVIILPVYALKYGGSEEDLQDRSCFNFGGELEKVAVKTQCTWRSG